MPFPNKLIISIAVIFMSILSCKPNSGNIISQEPDGIGLEKEDTVQITSARGITTVCGTERWSIKTGTDADAEKVNLTQSITTTVEALNNIPAPDEGTIKTLARQSPTETTVFTLDATLTQFRGEGDSDYHLILQDNKGNVMIAEIPAKDCVGSNSPFASGIEKARKTFDSKYTVLPPLDPSGNPNPFQDANVPVRITGVGFFDFPHGQNGIAKNAIELHPVLNIEFNPSRV